MEILLQLWVIDSSNSLNTKLGQMSLQVYKYNYKYNNTKCLDGLHPYKILY